MNIFIGNCFFPHLPMKNRMIVCEENIKYYQLAKLEVKQTCDVCW